MGQMAAGFNSSDGEITGRQIGRLPTLGLLQINFKDFKSAQCYLRSLASSNLFAIFYLLENYGGHCIKLNLHDG